METSPGHHWLPPNLRGSFPILGGLQALGLSLLRSQGRCLDLGFAGGKGGLAFCWVGLASSEIDQMLQHRVSKLLSELREPPDLVPGCPA